MDYYDGQDSELCLLVSQDKDIGPVEGDFVRLAHFPADVLATINQHVSGLDLLRLLTCGSKLLYYKLSKLRGATQFSILNGIDQTLRFADWRNRSFLAIRAFEGLRSLEMTGFFQTAFRHFTTATLKDLPSTLEVLRFDFVESLTMWIDLQDSQWTGYGDGYVARDGSVYHLDKKFPNLTSLQLTSRHWDTFSFYARQGVTIAFPWSRTMKEEFLSHLPSGMTKLRITLAHLPINAVQLLPKGLTTLHHDHYGIFLDFVCPKYESLLPQHHLKTLTSTSDGGLSLLAMGQLPSQLEYFTEILSGSMPIERSLDSPPSGEPLYVFPNTLKSLRMLSTNIAWDIITVKALPPTLTHLETKAGYWNDQLVELLPPLLETIILGSRMAENDTSPSLLAHLAHRPVRVFKPCSKHPWPWACFASLPATLKTFNQPLLTYSPIPGQESAAPKLALEYWLSQAPPDTNISGPLW